MIRVIAKRYASALADLSEAAKSLDAARTGLAVFAEAVGSAPSLQKLFSSPVFTPDQRKGVVQDLADRMGLTKETSRFLEHLAENGRIRYIRDIREAFEALLAERQNRAAVQITTAAPIAGGDLESLRKQLESLTGKTVEIETAVDASLIGGVRAKIGSVVYDGTIRNQLNKMRDQLVK